jgi:hypothetical protein
MSEQREWFIYGLCESGSHQVRYVGKTRNTHTRLRHHLSRARKGSTCRVHQWMRSLDELPCLVVLERGFGDAWRDAERKWISALPGLLNVTAGGDAASVSDEARKRAGEKLKTRIFTPEHRALISTAKTGSKRPDNAARNRKVSAGRRGRPLSISSEERERRRAAGKAASGKLARWTELTEDVREARRLAASEQMRRVWAQRKMEAA